MDRYSLLYNRAHDVQCQWQVRLTNSVLYDNEAKSQKDVKNIIYERCSMCRAN